MACSAVSVVWLLPTQEKNFSATRSVSHRSPSPAVNSCRSNRSVEREKVVQNPPYSISNTSTMPVKPRSASTAP